MEGLLLECRKCWRMLPRGNFSNDASQVGGKAYWCKGCYAPYKKATDARRRAASGAGYRALDVLRLFKTQNGRCAYCGTSLWVVFHVDHVIPLAKGGLNDPSNLKLACPLCNLQKSSKLNYLPRHAAP